VRAAADLAASEFGRYPAVAWAIRLLAELGNEDLAAAVKSSDLRALDEMIRTYAGTAFAARAQVEAARVQFEGGEINAAFERLALAAKIEEVRPEADRRRHEFLQEGRRRILQALENGLDGDVKGLRESMEKLRREFAGTSVARLADLVLEDLNR